MRIPWVLIVAALTAAPVAAQPTETISLTLEEAEGLALSSSETLRLQGLALASAARRLSLGIRDYLPQIELAASSSDTVNVAAQDSRSSEVSVTLRQPVYNGGRTALQRSLSRLQLALSRHSLEVARSDVLNDVWERYHTVLVLEAQRAVKRDSLARSRQQLEISRKERELGMSREIDLLDVEIAVSGQEIDLEAADNDLEQALYGLKKSLGLSPGQDLVLEGSIDSRYQGMAIGRPVSFFTAIARENNLDLQSAAYAITEMEAKVSMARSLFLPQIRTSITLSLSGPGLPLQTPALGFGIDLSFPQTASPVEAGVTAQASGADSTSRGVTASAAPLQSVTSRLDDSDALLQLESARAAWKTQARDLDFQVGQLLSTYARQSTAIRIGRRSLDLEQRKLRIIGQQVEDGSATRMELLREETQAADREVQVLSDVLGLLKTERSLERLLGIDPGGLALIAGGSNEGS
jgi:outer membrane protein TolC